MNFMSDSSRKKSRTDGSTARKADFIDKHVGQRIRDRRRSMDISQQEISEILSVSYQQLQKYESGQNRISAGRLFLIAHILKVDVSFFYQGLPPGEELFKGKIDELEYLLPEIDAMPPSSLRQALADLVHAVQESEKKGPES